MVMRDCGVLRYSRHGALPLEFKAGLCDDGGGVWQGTLGKGDGQE